MSTLYISHECFVHHDTGEWHPEHPNRIRVVEAALNTKEFQHLQRAEAPRASLEQLARIHKPEYLEFLHRHNPAEGSFAIDRGDTIMSPGSLEAAYRAAGAGVYAVDEVMSGKAKHAFCAVRPPGHHAEPDCAMGFCFFSSAAIAAAHAEASYGAERLAVVDFDVHHGNGTQAAFWFRPNFFYASTHQMPLFPYTGDASERGNANNIINAPLHSGDGGERFRAAFSSLILPALRHHQPDLLIISAGFDAHIADPLANLKLTEADFVWVTEQLIEVAEDCCGGRIVSMLEGGYDLSALAQSVAVHVKTLLEAY